MQQECEQKVSALNEYYEEQSCDLKSITGDLKERICSIQVELNKQKDEKQS